MLFLLIFLQQGPGWAQVQSYVDFDANGTVYKLPLTGGWTFSLSRGDQRSHVHLDAGVKSRQRKLAYFRGLISEGYRLEEAYIWGRDACSAGLFNSDLCVYSVLSFDRNVVVELISINKYDKFRREYEKSSGWSKRDLKNDSNVNIKKTIFPNESPLNGVYLSYVFNDNLEIQVRIRLGEGRSVSDKIENIVDDNIVLFCRKLVGGI
ncbi:hypothetical protein RP75_27590 [Agrobacterium arsenijevicii]|uniref:Uncharacterized protein n=1 Tax=Agrobacterium arsenijevicii TaxID=1585697 RepID=A0ABR5D043_9HYPH|nr:hypothetical protein RP75_27590 [Agrobacterium arsenijevicii]